MEDDVQEARRDRASSSPSYLPSGLACNLARSFADFAPRPTHTQTSLDPYERALYGALSGDVASVLPVCSTWEDVVWAHANALIESHVEAGLASSPSGRYYQRGSVAPLDPKTTTLDPEDPLVGSAAQGKSVRQELEDVFEQLVRSDQAELAMAAKNPFHISQAYLIVGKVESLLETFVERLESAANETEAECVHVAFILSGRASSARSCRCRPAR